MKSLIDLVIISFLVYITHLSQQIPKKCQVSLKCPTIKNKVIEKIKTVREGCPDTEEIFKCMKENASLRKDRQDAVDYIRELKEAAFLEDDCSIERVYDLNRVLNKVEYNYSFSDYPIF